jgi:hypothetical protein
LLVLVLLLLLLLLLLLPVHVLSEGDVMYDTRWAAAWVSIHVGAFMYGISPAASVAVPCCRHTAAASVVAPTAAVIACIATAATVNVAVLLLRPWAPSTAVALLCLLLPCCYY